MTFCISKDDVQKLSEGRNIRCDDVFFRPSSRVTNICRAMLIHKHLLDNYDVVLEDCLGMWTIYLKTADKGEAVYGRQHSTFFKTKAEVDRFVDRLVDRFNEYGEIRRIDFRKMLGMKNHSPVYRRTGWTSLNNLQVIRCTYHGEDGWRLILPPPTEL